jgi:hypothetical protein
MKIRYAVELALAGWYLMMPPTTGKSVFPLDDTDAPLSR